MRQKRFDIICLGDTHFTKEDEPWYQVEWGYKAYFSSFSSNQTGIAVLLRSSFQHKVHNIVQDNNGRFLLLDIEVEGKFRFTFATLYGPNKDDPFLLKISPNKLWKLGMHL
jgi:exonuclease III